MLKAPKTQSSNFGLKDEAVQLIRPATTEVAQVSLTDLESIRTEAHTVPASKHGLEAITGASCDTAAQ